MAPREKKAEITDSDNRTSGALLSSGVKGII